MPLFFTIFNICYQSISWTTGRLNQVNKAKGTNSTFWPKIHLSSPLLMNFWQQFWRNEPHFLIFPCCYLAQTFYGYLCVCSCRQIQVHLTAVDCSSSLTEHSDLQHCFASWVQYFFPGIEKFRMWKKVWNRKMKLMKEVILTNPPSNILPLHNFS